MTQEEYMTQLKKHLRKLPSQDYEDAVEYFNEYFSETDGEGEQKLMAELGSPKKAASDLISNLLDKKILEESERQKTPSRSTLRIAVLALLAAPVAGPLLAALLAVLLATAITVLSVIFCIFVFAFCVLLIGSKLLLKGIVAIPYSIPGGCMILGTGVFGIGAAILLCILGIYLSKWIGLLFVKIVQHFTRKRGN